MEDTMFNGEHAHQLSESCSTNPVSFHSPEVNDNRKPKIGQEFDTLDDVYKFYNEYARAVGFGVRIGSSIKNRFNVITRKEYVCYKEGQRVVKGQEKQLKRIRGSTRQHCRAKIAVVKDSVSGKYKIRVFIEQHSHQLATPKKIHFLRSHRSVLSAQRSLTEQLTQANIPTHQQISILELQAGGIENIGCIEKDIYNVRRDRVKSMDGHDANMLNDYFISKNEENPSFTYTIEADNENCIRRCFWADATSIIAFKSFGDVVVFDTTYQTNKYSMIFAPLVGVNHHGQTVLLGSAFLSDETTESFEWLFEQWLRAMPGGPPGMIITDQDPAMAKAIEHMLPDTFHRLCIWHIMSKFPEKLSATALQAVKADFRNCIWDSEDRDEFDRRWMDVLVKGGLQDNAWLKNLYNLRFKWVPAYVKHVFAAGMSSSQRAESCHSFFKKYLSKNNSLNEFITCFDRALKKQRHSELNADHIDIDEQPILKTRILMEKQMASIYTRYIFKKFQEEVFESPVYVITCVFEDDVKCKYDVEHASGDVRVRKIDEDKTTTVATCSCKLFEWEGIPCRHLVAFFQFKRVFQLPNMYIKMRWSKGAKMNVVLDSQGVDLRVSNASAILLRRCQNYERVKRLIDIVSICDERTARFAEVVEATEAEMNDNPIPTIDIAISQSRISQSQVYSEPKKVRAKGCGKRLKSGKEKAIAKLKTKENRKCNACGQVGQHHDSRNCPLLMNHVSQPSQPYDDEYMSTGGGGATDDFNVMW